jgi:hypothetical protein
MRCKEDARELIMDRNKYNMMFGKKKLDKGIVHYYNFLINSYIPYRGGEEQLIYR